MTLVQGDRRNRTSTHPAHPDPLLRGRTYAIPFDTVWTAALRLAGGGLPRWNVIRADDGPGVIQAEVRPRLWGENGDALVRVGLDADAQTRVDLVSSSRGNRNDLGASRRRAIRFFKALDRALAAGRQEARLPLAGAHARG
ncbi:MAG TPA: DUF1499 domain-containing protein [Longimicrobiales bacterium]|nr:DUF1499 domain-containing protein [Longimicrobiales bacterium]